MPQFSARRWWARGAALGAVLLVLATGLCLFDGDHDGSRDHAMRPDLCLGMLAIALSVFPLIRPVVRGWVLLVPATLVPAVAIHLPDPPPKIAPLS
jgi:hypothetical protein